MKWTISRRIGGLAGVLIAFILAIVANSIFVVRGIERELAELSRYELPLIQIATDIEVAQLEQNIHLERLLVARESPSGTGADIDALHELALRMEGRVAEGIRLLESRPEPMSAAVRAEWQESLATLKVLSERHADFRTSPVFAGGGDFRDLLPLAEELEQAVIRFVAGLEKTARRHARLIERQERAFFIVTVSLGMAAVILGSVLSFLVVIGIRSRIDRLNQGAERVARAIVSGQVLPAGALEIEADDEFAELSRNLSRLVEQFSEDISRRSELAKRLETLATTDPLTGAFNRYKWDRTITAELQRVASNPFDLSLIIFDIDHFKRVNDRFGHDIGDAVLRRTVERARTVLRDLDDLFRLGGEEFVVLARYSDLEDARQLAELIRLEIAAHSFPEAGRVTVSLGVATYTAGWSVEEFFRASDQALYRAKESGRNQVRVAGS